MHIRQATLDSVVVVRRLRVIQAQEVKDGRVEVVNGRHILDGPEAELARQARSARISARLDFITHNLKKTNLM